jgi:hypothetical protein
MQRYVVIAAVLGLLALPVVGGADSHGRYWDDQGWLPSEWTPTLPARETVDAARLLELLVQKGVIAPQEAARLGQPQMAMPTGQSQQAAREAGASSR